jgi:hypothetical protein
MYGGESVSDLNALRSFRVCARYNIAPFSCALLDSEFPQFGVTVHLLCFCAIFRHFCAVLRHFCAVLRHFYAALRHFYAILRHFYVGFALAFARIRVFFSAFLCYFCAGLRAFVQLAQSKVGL